MTCARGFSAALSDSSKHANLDCSPSQIYIQFGYAEGGFQHAFTCGLAMLSVSQLAFTCGLATVRLIYCEFLHGA